MPDSDAYQHDDVVRCLDRLGRHVYLPTPTWFENILLDHTEMTGAKESVMDTLESPDVHVRDRGYDDREIFRRGVQVRRLGLLGLL